jgi:hypothetical protein
MPRILGKQTIGGTNGNLTTSQASSYTMPEDGVLNSLVFRVGYDNNPTNRPGDEDIRAAVYTGGTSDTNPNGAVLLEDLGVFELDGTYGGSFITFNTSGRYEIAAGTRVWIAVKSDATFGLGFSFDTGTLGDSVTGFVNDSDDEVAWESTISSTGTQNTANVTMYITYTAKGETKTTKSPELITNGGFDTNSDWNLNVSWSIADGVLYKEGGVFNNTSQNFDTQLNKKYLTTFTVASYSGSGQVRIALGASGTSTWRTSVGTYTEILTPVETGYIRIISDANFSGSIDNVSVKELPPIQSDTQWFYDDFNRPNQSITASSDWDENTLYISDNGTNWFIEDGALGGQDFAALNGFAFLNTASYQWTNDQLAEVVYADIGSFDYAGPAVRLNFGPGHESGSGYVLRHDGAPFAARTICRVDNGTVTQGPNPTPFAINVGDKVRLQAAGTTISCYVNGNLAVSWTDSTYESGSVGVFYKKEDVTQTKFDSFYAQNIVSGQTGKPFKIS